MQRRNQAKDEGLERSLIKAIYLHATMVVIEKVGVLLKGKANSGKSSLALELIHHGHQLLSDDMVNMQPLDHHIVAHCPNENYGFLYTRALGLLDIAKLYGMASLCQSHRLDLIIELSNITAQENSNELTRNPHYALIDHVQVPVFTLSPLVQNRALHVELLVKNHKLQQQGHDAIANFNKQL